jgi:hypothetical protein
MLEEGKKQEKERNYCDVTLTGFYCRLLALQKALDLKKKITTLFMAGKK